jgi:hypothetical protein
LVLLVGGGKPMRATQAATFWTTHSVNDCVVFLSFNSEADSKNR